MAHTLLVITLVLTMTSRVFGQTRPEQSNKDVKPLGGQRVCLDGYNFTFGENGKEAYTYCFKLNTDEVNRTAAEQHCYQDYAELIRLDILKPPAVKSGLTKNFDNLMATLKGRSVWVGMKKQGGRLVWDGMSPSLATSNSNGGLIKWRDGHPSLRGDCVKGMLKNRTSPHVELMTASCEERLPFICYRKSVRVKLTKGAPYCPKGWHGNDLLKKCYHHPTDINGRFDTAVHACYVLEGRVTMPIGSFSNSVIKHVAIRQNLRTGEPAPYISTPKVQNNLTAPISKAVWLGFKQKTGNYFNLNDAQVNQTFFSTASSNGKGSCVTMIINEERNSWNREDCNASRKFICEKDAEIPDPVRLINESRNYTEVDETDIEDHILVCEAKNYYPETPVIWYKDGLPLSVPPGAVGFRLNVANVKKNNSHVSFVMGSYHCTVKGRDLLDEVTSYPTSIRIRGLFTLWGRLHLPEITASDKKRYIRAWLLQGRGSSGVFYQMVYSLVGIAPRNTFGAYIYNITWSVEGHPSWQGVVVEFTVNYLESDIITVLRYNLNEKQIFRQKLSEVRTNMANTSLLADMYSQKVLLHSLLVKNMESTCSGNKLFKRHKMQADDLELYNNEFCFERSIKTEKYGALKFPTTPAGLVGKTLLNCLSTGMPFGSAACVANGNKGACWGPVKWISDCPKTELKAVAETQVTEINAAQVARTVEKITRASESLNSTDVILTSRILKNIANISQIDKAAGIAIIRTVDNLIRVDRQTLLDAQKTNRATSRILNATETIINHVDLAQEESWSVVRPLIAVETRKLAHSTSFSGFGTSNVNESFQHDNINSYQNDSKVDLTVVDTVILLPINSIQTQLIKEGMASPDESIRVSYTVYSNKNLFMSMVGDNISVDVPEQGTLAGCVIGGSTGGIPVYNLSKPVSIIFRPFDNAGGYRCVFWDFTMKDGYGGWSDKGCHFHKRKQGSIICRCDHLTNFAILFDRNPKKTTSTVLHFLSIVGLSLSLLGLVMTILTFLIFKQFRKGRGFRILFQLAVSLFCTDALMLAGLEKTELLAVCSAVAALLLYFLLAAFCWMVVEAVHQYLLFVKVYGSDVSGFMLKAALLAWGIPAMVVGVVAAVDYKMFRGPENYCWINQAALYYAFMLPVGLVLIINTVLFSMVLREFFCDRGHKDKGGSRDDTSRQIIVAVACFLVIGLTWVFGRFWYCFSLMLGLTWVFGFFAIDDAREPFLYLFCIFNSIQGFLIFIFYIVRVKQIRAAWTAFICCGRVDTRSDTTATTRSETA